MNSLVGNVVADPELRFTPNGKAVASFRLAVNNRAQNEAGAWVDVGTDFHDIVVWQDQAERVETSIAKGNRVIVVGDFRKREWETQEGEKRTAMEFVAQDVGLSLKWAKR
jgi:single-strand DNA-binding protein